MQNNAKTPEKGANILHPKNAFASLFKENAKKQTLASFAEELTDKPYFETHGAMFTLAKVGSIGTALASVAMAYVYTDALFTNLLPASFGLIAPALAVGLLFGLEYLKREFFRNFCTEYVKRKAIKMRSLALGLALVICSSLLSVFGVIDFVEDKGSEDVQAINEVTQAQIQAVKSEYEGKRKDLIQRRKAITDRNTYKGKTWLPKSERANVQALEAALIALDSEERKDIADLQSMGKSEVQTSEQGTQSIALQMAVASGLNELLCIAALFFMYSFKFRSLVESGLVTSENPMPATIKPNYKKSFAGFAFNAASSEQSIPHVMPNSIGHSMPTGNHDLASENQENALHGQEFSGFKKELFADVLSGNRDFRTLTKKHKVNVSTVKQHLLFIDNINA